MGRVHGGYAAVGIVVSNITHINWSKCVCVCGSGTNCKCCKERGLILHAESLANRDCIQKTRFLWPTLNRYPKK